MSVDKTSFPLEIDVFTVKALLDNGQDVLLIDCREQNEYDLVRIKGARLLPMSEISRRVDELEPFRSKHIVVHCHHGGRSMKVTQWLRSQGFDQTQNMAGGIDAWSTNIDPTLPRY